MIGMVAGLAEGAGDAGLGAAGAQNDREPAMPAWRPRSSAMPRMRP